MVIHAFPIAKLGALFVKQLSKPIANFCKNRAKHHPFFRSYVCMPPAQFYNWCEVKMKMWILNLGKPMNIPVLNEAQAIELGANLLGEGILFFVAAVILVAEYNRSSRKEEKKEQQTKYEKQLLNQQLQELYFTTQQQSAQITELLRKLYDLESKTVHKPWVKTDDREIEPVKKSKPKKSKKTPPPPPGVIVPPIVVATMPENTADKENDVQCSLVLEAVASIEKDLWRQEKLDRQPSILSVAINYIYNDIYRLPLSL